MPYAAALSEHPVGTHAAEEAADKVAASIGTAPDAALLFLTAPHTESVGEIAAVVRERLQPGALIGASAVSVVGGDLEIEERPAVSLWAARFEGVTPVRFTAFRDGDVIRIEGPGKETLDSAHTFLLLPDPFTFPVGDLVEQLAVDHPEILVVGGLASAAQRPGDNRLVLDDQVFRDGAVGLLLGGPTRVTAVVSQGCRPIGRPLVVTKAEGNLIYELAGRTAYDQLASLLDELSDEDHMRVAQGLHIGRVIDEHKTDFGRGDFLIRGVLGVDERTGAMAVGDEMSIGSIIQFQVRDAVSADEDLHQLMDGQAADGALLFTCNGRGTHLFSEPHHDAGLVSRMLDRVPIGGMFCAGEVGPVGGRSFVHGFTASLALFHDG